MAYLLLAAVLIFAVIRPWDLPEAIAAVPAAGIVVFAHLSPWSTVAEEFTELTPTLIFLGAILVLAWTAAEEGVFTYAADLMLRYGMKSGQRLFTLTFVAASLSTAFLSIDATVVLLTPIVISTAVTSNIRPRPFAYACNHLSNSASVLLPVSNLTNLLLFAQLGISFTTFGMIMIGPGLVIIFIEYLALSWFFSNDLHAPVMSRPARASRRPSIPVLAILASTIVGFTSSQFIHVPPAYVALAGALGMTFYRLRRVGPGQRSTTLWSMTRAANPEFLAFVAALSIVVLPLRLGPAGSVLEHHFPAGETLLALVLASGFAALLANVVNNVPAALMLAPIVAHSPPLALAALIGLNVGPNLTYTGSLATLLWRRILDSHDHPADVLVFTRLGLLTVPASLLGGTLALWASLHLLGRI